MSSPAAAIAWEIWRKNRWAFAAMGLALAICSIANYSAIHWSEDLSLVRPTLLSFGATFMGLSIFSLLGVFGYSEPDKETGFAFPERFFVLPISTIGLVTLFAGYGLLAGSLLYLAWAYFVFSPLEIFLPIRYHLVCIATGLLSFQAIVWGLAPFPKIRAIAAAGLVFGLLYIFVSPLGEATSWTSSKEARMAMGLAALSILAYLAAWCSVSAERHGAWLSLRRFPVWKNASIFFRSFPSRTSSKPHQALAWMEWRRNGMIPSLVIVSIFLLCCFAIIAGSENEILRNISLLAIGLILPLIITLLSIFIARDCVSNQLSVSIYFAAQPCSTEALLLAKLKNLMTVGLITVACALVCLSLQFVVLEMGQTRHDSEYNTLANMFYFVLRVSPVFFLSLLVGGLPIWLTGRITSIPIASALWLFFVFSLIYTRSLILKYIPDATPIILAVLIILKFGIAYQAFKCAYRRNLLKVRTILLFIGAWLAFTLISLSAISLLPVDFPWSRKTLILIVPLLCPLARLAVAPLALDFNRHR